MPFFSVHPRCRSPPFQSDFGSQQLNSDWREQSERNESAKILPALRPRHDGGGPRRSGKNDDPYFSYDGTTAKWDPTLVGQSDVAKSPMGSWENEEDEIRGSSAIGNGCVKMLTRTASDRFYITAKEEDGYFALYYHPADNPDSQKMQEIKAALNLTRPVQYDRGLCYEDTGWAGPMRWEQYSGAQGIAEKIEYYLLELHPYTDRYYLTEPEPGQFYN